MSDTSLPVLSYADAGATGEDPWPSARLKAHGHRLVRVTTPVGRGPAAFRVAAAALMEWRMHRAMGVRMDTAHPRAVPGAAVTVGLGVGPLRVHGPCRVVWTREPPADEEECGPGARAGWAYGTLPGHPVRGEEAFVLWADGDGTVLLTVLAFSTPAAVWARAAGPLLRFFQFAYARRCGEVLGRTTRRALRPVRAKGVGRRGRTRTQRPGRNP